MKTDLQWYTKFLHYFISHTNIRILFFTSISQLKCASTISAILYKNGWGNFLGAKAAVDLPGNIFFFFQNGGQAKVRKGALCNGSMSF